MSHVLTLGLCGALSATLLAPPAFGSTPPGSAPRDISVLILVGEWFGDSYFPLAQRILDCGWRLSRVGVDSSYRGCYNKARDVVLHSDILVGALTDFSPVDCLVIPSGPQFRKFNTNQAVLQFVREAYDAGLLIASFCTGNMVVKASGVYDVPEGSPLFPDRITLVKERVLLGPRGGGPPPGDGYLSAPIDELCAAIAEQLGVACPASVVTPREEGTDGAGATINDESR